jgi:hypothetical protein
MAIEATGYAGLQEVNVTICSSESGSCMSEGNCPDVFQSSCAGRDDVGAWPDWSLCGQEMVLQVWQ